LNAEKAKLGEVYVFMRDIAKLHHEFREDLQNKCRLISELIPNAIFQSSSTSKVEEALALMLDLWVYHNIVYIK
jgi:hypothetical protein